MMQSFFSDISYFWAQMIFFALFIMMAVIVHFAIVYFKKRGLAPAAVFAGYWLLAGVISIPLFLYVETWANNKLCPKGTHYVHDGKTRYFCGIDR
jgi:hypothetical protein